MLAQNIVIYVDFMLVEVYLLLEFLLFIFLFLFVRYLGSMMPPYRHFQSSIKGINIEGCKIPIGSEPLNKRNTRL